MPFTEAHKDATSERRVAALETKLSAMAWRVDRLWEIDRERRAEELERIREKADLWLNVWKAAALLLLGVSLGGALFKRLGRCRSRE